MKVELISYSNLGEKVCGIASKTCVSENIPDVNDNVMKSLRSAISSGHEAVLEHWSATFAVSGVSRALTHQLVRHRVASYSQQSQRYVDMDGFEYVIPQTVFDVRDSFDMGDEYPSNEPLYAWDWIMGEINALYRALIDKGVPEEDARYILPNACTTNIIVTMNARELRHFFSLRCCNRAQWEIRELANKMLELVKEVAPTIFANAGPSCVQMGYCPEGKRSCRRAVTLDRMLDIVDEQKTAEGGRH